MTEHADWLRPADAAILAHLSEERPTYVAIVANRLGLHLDYAQQRFEKLAANDFVEPVSHEIVYRVTERGEAQLDAYEDAEASADTEYAVVD